MTKIILATASPDRRKAFEFLGLKFSAEESEVDEKFSGRPETPEELVRILSKLKAEAVAKNHSEGIVIGFDSVGRFNDNILEKPKTREEAFERLRALSGNSFQYYTGIYMKNISAGQSVSKAVKTDVFMRNLDDSEINKYLDESPEFKRHALGFDRLEHYSSTFISRIEGSNNLTRSVPLEIMVEMLSQIGYKQ